MTEVQRADPAARRWAVLVVVAGALAGALLIAGFERWRIPLSEWLLSDPVRFARRLKLLSHLAAALLSAPLFGFAVYLGVLGGKVVRAQQFPPPRQRVVRDTPILRGKAALVLGRRLKLLAVGFAVAGAALWFLLWWFAVVLGGDAF